ncbi:MAG: NfeD family protein [Enterocloster sp.]
MSAGWFLTFLLFSGLELSFRCLVSLWFAAGALGAWCAQSAGWNIERQLAVFLTVSAAALVLVRPVFRLLDRCRRERVHH